MLKREKSNFFIGGIVLVSVATLLLVMRIVVNLIAQGIYALMPQEWQGELLIDSIFSLGVQILACFAIPLLIYRFGLKKDTTEIFAYSNYRKTKPVNFVIVIFIGIVGFFVANGLSSMWISLLSGFGYTYTPSESAIPDTFNIGYFLLTLFLSAVLPACCEEFLNRGALFTILRERFSTSAVILICGAWFGLFHENIEQVFYTACFGMMMGFIVIKTNSIFPAMVVHFVNNALSVILSSVSDYASGDLLKLYNTLFGGYAFLIIFIISIPVLVILLYMLDRVNADTPGARPPVLRKVFMIHPVSGVPVSITTYSDEFPPKNVDLNGIDPFDGKDIDPDLFGQKVADIDPFDGKAAPQPPLFKNLSESKGTFMVRKDGKWEKKKAVGLKPKECIGWLGAITVAALATIFSLIWGFII